MKTRSGKTYEIKCGCCRKWYPNPKFNNLCSRCYSVKYPELWRIFREDNRCRADYIPKKTLENFISKNEVTFSGCRWQMLITSIKDDSDFGILITLLNDIKRINREFLGITAKQGAKLYEVFKKAHGDKYEGNMGGKSDWRWQHLFAGMIFDTWNIKTDTHGSVAYCYYGNFGDKPRGSMVGGKWVSPWMSFSQKKRDFWLNSIPRDFGKFIN